MSTEFSGRYVNIYVLLTPEWSLTILQNNSPLRIETLPRQARVLLCSCLETKSFTFPVPGQIFKTELTVINKQLP